MKRHRYLEYCTCIGCIKTDKSMFMSSVQKKAWKCNRGNLKLDNLFIKVFSFNEVMETTTLPVYLSAFHSLRLQS